MNKVVVGLLIVMLVSTLASAKELYRAPSAGDKGAYYVLQKQYSGPLVQALTSRIGKNNADTAFTKLRINCDTKEYFVLETSVENGARDSPTDPLNDISTKSKWVSLVKGSSKYDLVMYLCN